MVNINIVSYINIHHTYTDRTRQVHAEVQAINAKYKAPGTIEVHGSKKNGFEGIFGDCICIYTYICIYIYAPSSMCTSDI